MQSKSWLVDLAASAMQVLSGRVVFRQVKLWQPWLVWVSNVTARSSRQLWLRMSSLVPLGNGRLRQPRYVSFRHVALILVTIWKGAAAMFRHVVV